MPRNSPLGLNQERQQGNHYKGDTGHQQQQQLCHLKRTILPSSALCDLTCHNYFNKFIIAMVN